MDSNNPTFQMMPLLLGPLSNLLNPEYAEVEAVVFQYLSDAEAIAPLLPKCFEPGNMPSVTVAFQDCRGVDFLAGNDYRLVMIAVGAQFKGEENSVEGNYVLVMFENAAIPIVLGRERLGIPKIYADITPLKILPNKHLRFEVSVWGHLLMGIDLAPPFKKQNLFIRKAASTLSSRRPLLGYKLIPATSLDDPPDVEYPTASYSDNKIDQLWLGKTGTLYIGDPKEEDIRYFKTLLDALRTIPVRQVTMISRSRGSAVLRDDKSHRLR